MDSEEQVRLRLAPAVAAWMKHAKVTPTSLHKQTGKSRDVFYRLVKGEGFPALDTLIAFCSVVGTTPSELIRGEMPPPDARQSTRRAAGPQVSVEERVASLESSVRALDERSVPAALEASREALERVLRLEAALAQRRKSR